MKLKICLLILILPWKMFLSAQGEVILIDTLFEYLYPAPEESILSSMIIYGSDSADQVISELIFEIGEGDEEGEGTELSGPLIPMIKNTIEYDATGRKILALSDMRNPETEDWEKYNKRQWTYYENGQVWQYSKYYYLNEQVSSFSSSRIEYEYDSLGNVVREIYLTLYDEDLAEYKKKTDFLYNENGNLTLKSEFDWLNGWVTKSSTHYFYNDSVGLIKTERYSSGRKYIVDYIYDESGRIKTEMEIHSNSDDSDRILKARTEYLYAEEADTIKKISYNYKIDTEDWIPSSRKDYILDSLDREIFKAEYFWDIWENYWNGFNAMTEISYNEKGDIVSEIYSVWNDIDRAWVATLYRECHFSDRSMLSTITENSWSETDNDFVASSKKVFKYDHYETIINRSICPGDEYDWFGEYFKETGIYSKAYISVKGRDSIAFLDLFVIEKPDLPDLEITRESTITEQETSFYSLPEFQDISYEWSVENGTIASYPQQNTVEVEWGSRGTGMISCVLKHELGCELYTARLEVLLNPNTNNGIVTREFSLYPNPARNLLNVTSIDSDHFCFIMNLQGELLLETRQNEINIEDLSVGSYILIVKDRSGSVVQRQMFIKSEQLMINFNRISSR